MKRILFIIILFTSCQEEISLELNQARDKLVVEGSIEPGFPPYVILTKNQGYFSKIDAIHTVIYLLKMRLLLYLTPKIMLQRLLS